jgi:hypothetical protein
MPRACRRVSVRSPRQVQDLTNLSRHPDFWGRLNKQGIGHEAIAQTLGIGMMLVEMMMPVMDDHARIRAIRDLAPRDRDARRHGWRDRRGARVMRRCGYVSGPVGGDVLRVVLGRWLAAAAPAGRPPAAVC